MKKGVEKKYGNRKIKKFFFIIITKERGNLQNNINKKLHLRFLGLEYRHPAVKFYLALLGDLPNS